MATRGKITELYDVSAIKAQQAKVVRLIDSYVKTVNSTNAKIGQAGGKPSEMIANIEKVSAAHTKQATIVRELTKEQALANIQVSERNKLLKLQAQLENSVNGSREQAVAKIKLLELQLQQLGVTTEFGKKKQAELNAELEKYNLLLAKPKVVAPPPAQVSSIDNTTSAEAIKLQEAEQIKFAQSIEYTTQQQLELNAAIESGAASGNQRAKLVKAGVDTASTASVVTYRDELEKLTGTLEQNEGILTSVKVELAQVTGQIRSLDKTSRTYEADLARLTSRQSALKAEAASLNTTLKNQNIIENSAVGSLDALNARLNLLNQAYTRLGVTAQASPLGLGLKTEIQTLSTAVIAQETALNRAQKSVGQYSSGITKAAGSAFNAIRKISYVLPGIGIAGIFSLIAEGVSNLVSELFKGQKSLDSFKSSQDALNKAFAESSYKDAVKNVDELTIRIGLAKDGFADKNIVLEQYNKTLGESTGLAKTLDEAESLLIANGDNYIKVTLLKAAANVALSDAAQLAVDLAKDQSEKTIVDKAVDEDKLRRTIEQSDAYQQLNQKVNEGYAISIVEGNKASRALEDFYQNQLSFLVGGTKAKNKKTLEDIAKDFLKQASLIELLLPLTTPKEPKGKEDTTAADEAKLRLEAQKLELEQQANIQKEIVQIESFSFDERIDALRKYVDLKAEIINLEADYELKTAGKTQAERDDIDQKRNIRLTDLRHHATELLKINLKEEKAAEETHAYDMEQISKDLTDSLIADTNRWLKAQADANDKAEKLAKDTAEERKKLEKELANELTNLFFTSVTARFEKEKNLIQDQIDLLDAKKAKDIEVANQTIANTAQRADAIAIIEARASAQKEQLQKKQRDLDIKKAQFDKAQSIVRIIQETAFGVIKATAALMPQLVPIIIAIGAAQLAAVALQPIPRYKTGTKNHPGGQAVVGDAPTSELVDIPGKGMFVANKPMLVDLPKGTKVFPDINKVVMNEQMQDALGRMEGKSVVINNNNGDVVAGLASVERAIKKIPQSQITVENLISKRIRNGNSINKYLN